MSQRRIRRRKAKARRTDGKFEQQHPTVVLHESRKWRTALANAANHAKQTSIPMQGAR